MQVPLEIAFHGVPKDEATERLVRDRASKLERHCDHIGSCRVAIESPHRTPGGAPVYQVRIDLRVPPSHEVVVREESRPATSRADLTSVAQAAFDAAARRLDKLTDRQRGRVKAHPHNEPTAVVARLFDDYGFLRTVDDRDVFFHRNSVLDDRFDELEEGRAVAFTEEMGEKGPQASTVRPVGGAGPLRP